MITQKLTPLERIKKFEKKIHTGPIFLKREDLGYYHSHKGRSIPHMIQTHLKNGTTVFAISSSGNAAMAAILAVLDLNRETESHAQKTVLHVFYGKRLHGVKKKLILEKANKNESIFLHETAKPKADAFVFAKKNNAVLLRQSTDETALAGYETLAQEIFDIPELSAIFIPTSSGTFAEALGAYGIQHKKNVQIHIVQTTACHPIAETFDTNFIKTDYSTAGAIVDKIAHRKKTITKLIKKTHGHGWVVSDAFIRETQKLLFRTQGIQASSNGILGLAGMQKALQKGGIWRGPVCCIVTGQ